MAQTPGYEHDIFISYAHNDNYPIVEGHPGWVDQFEYALDSWLRKRRGMAGLKIWRDKKRMTGNTLFDDAIQRALRSSAIFIALTSHNYLKSDYCRDELRWFHQYHGQRPGGLRVGDASRIFNVLCNNIQHAHWPNELQGAGGFPMHDAQSDQDAGEFTPPDESAFQKQLRPVVVAIEALVQQAAPAAALPAVERPQVERVAIFVADVPDMLQDFKERIMAEAQSRDVQIVTDVPPPMDAAGHSEAVSQALDQASFSIHLLDQWPGRKILDQKDTTYPREQHEIAFRKTTPQLVWVPPDLDIEVVKDEAQRQFLYNCETRPRTLGQYEFVRGLQNEFVNLVLEHIERCRQSSADQSIPLSYLIDTHQKDQRYAFKLAAFLAEKGAAVDFNQESQDPTISLAKFEQSVKTVKNLILICGTVGPAWLVGRIKKAFKAISEQFESEERSSLEHIWLFLAPNSTGRPDLPLFPPLINIGILDNSKSDRIDPEVTSQLLGAGAAQ